MNKSVKTIVQVVLLVFIVALVYQLYGSIMVPVNFDKQKAHRESVAIQRLKDIRTLQVAYKTETGKFTSTLDSLQNFYENGQMTVLMQVGSIDDSLAVSHTEKIKKANKKITNQDLYKMYLEGDKDLVFTVENKINVKDTLFRSRPDFCIDSLKVIPFSGGVPIIMAAEAKTVSGVIVPLFEAKIPYDALLKGLNKQLIINLKADRRDMNKYEGLQVGSIAAPNNNAGNWE